MSFYRKKLKIDELPITLRKKKLSLDLQVGKKTGQTTNVGKVQRTV